MVYWGKSDCLDENPELDGLNLIAKGRKYPWRVDETGEIVWSDVDAYLVIVECTPY